MNRILIQYQTNIPQTKVKFWYNWYILHIHICSYLCENVCLIILRTDLYILYNQSQKYKFVIK